MFKHDLIAKSSLKIRSTTQAAAWRGYIPYLELADFLFFFQKKKKKEGYCKHTITTSRIPSIPCIRYERLKKKQLRQKRVNCHTHTGVLIALVGFPHHACSRYDVRTRIARNRTKQ